MRSLLSPFAMGDFDRVFGALTGFDDVAGHPFFSAPRRRTSAAPSFVSWREDDALHLRTEVPGLTPDDVELTLDGETLNLKLERQVAYEDSQAQRLERGAWTMTRALALPFRPDPDSVVAKLEHGVLTVTLTEAEASKPRTIKVLA